MRTGGRKRVKTLDERGALGINDDWATFSSERIF
jgi:hypothetical protein